MWTFGPTPPPRRVQERSKPTEQPLRAVRGSQPGSQEARLFTGARAISMTTGQPTASCFGREEIYSWLGCSEDNGDRDWQRSGDPKHPVWGKEALFLRVA